MTLTPKTIEKMEQFLLPFIRKAVNTVLADLFDRKESVYRNYSLGCVCWDYIITNIKKELSEQDFFKVEIDQNVLTLSCNNGNENITFYISKVDNAYKLPTAGRRIKENAKQLYFSDEIREMCEKNVNGVYALTYDVDKDNGLGDVAFCIIRNEGNEKYVSDVVHIFGNETSELSSFSNNAQFEKVEEPKVGRQRKSSAK